MTPIYIVVITILLQSMRGLRIEQLTKNPGIFFEDMGKTYLYADELKVVIFYNLEEFKTELDKLGSVIQQINEICQQYNDNIRMEHICNGSAKQLSLLLYQVEQRNSPLDAHSRKKRGYVNVVGTLAKTLFGTLTEDDAKYYNEHINTIENK